MEKEVNRIEKTLDAAHNRRRKSITMMETRRKSLRLRVSRRKSMGQSKVTMPQEKMMNLKSLTTKTSCWIPMTVNHKIEALCLGVVLNNRHTS